MRWHAVTALFEKDVRLYFRNRLFAFITPLSLIAFVVIYLVMPETVDETLSLGIHAPGTAEALVAPLRDEGGVAIERTESNAALRELVLENTVAAGLSLPADLLERLAAGGRPVVQLYLPADAPPETREMLEVMIQGLALGLSDLPLDIEARVVILGPDRAGEQIPHRDRMLPLLAVLVLMVETLGLASLLAEEIQTGTVRALLATPLGIGELFMGKGISGVLMSFTQALLVMLFVGGLAVGAPIIVLTLLLGALLVTALGFLMASAAKDMLSVVGLGMLVLILLGVPPFGVIFPGTVTAWARIVPSHYIAHVIHQVANLGAGWGQVWPQLFILLVFNLALFAAGIVMLRRRFL